MRSTFAIMCLGFLAVCGSASKNAEAAPANGYAAGGKRLQILGMKYGDSVDQVLAVLAKEEFSPNQYASVNQCEKGFTFEQAVARQAKLSSPDYLVNCGIGMKDAAGRNIIVRFYIFPEGFKLAEIEYTFPFSGDEAALEKTLAMKYGPASSHARGNAIFAENPKDPKGLTIAASIGGSSNGYLHMSKPSVTSWYESKAVLQPAVMKANGSGTVKF